MNATDTLVAAQASRHHTAAGQARRGESIAAIHAVKGGAMAKWFLEPGHTSAEFCARHMMVTHVRGHFKNVHGSLEFDPAHPKNSSVALTIDARGLWTGEPDRDAHLRSNDFLDVENYPTITFEGDEVEVIGS